MPPCATILWIVPVGDRLAVCATIAFRTLVLRCNSGPSARWEIKIVHVAGRGIVHMVDAIQALLCYTDRWVRLALRAREEP